MKYVKYKQIDGQIQAPASKSMMLRAVAASALVRGKTQILNPSACSDARAALGIVSGLGTRILQQTNRAITLRGGFEPQQRVLDCKESGLCLRMFTAICGLWNKPFTLVGSGSLSQRPIDMVTRPMRDLGARIKTQDKFLPVEVQGPFRGGRVSLNGSVSSQFLTGLLMALPLCQQDSTIEVNDLKSTPYVQMTLEILSDFGIHIEPNEDLSVFPIRGSQQYATERHYTVEGDWSGAAAILVAGALAGSVSVTGLNPDSAQADKAIVQALQASRARVEVSQGSTRVSRGPLQAITFDATDCPDLFPALVALCVHCQGTSELIGADRLHHKESERAGALYQEFKKMGAAIELRPNRLIVKGSALHHAVVDSHADHRIAMACAVGGMDCGVTISDEMCVAKSYPAFFEDLATIGAQPT